MKTNIENIKLELTTNNVVELSNYYSSFIKDIKYLIDNEKYKELNKYRLTHDIVEILDPLVLKESGICNIKRFKRYLKQAFKTNSLQSINKFLNLVHKKIIKLDYSPKLINDKHEKIQKLRKEWLKQQDITNKLLLEYKNEKSNFYK